MKNFTKFLGITILGLAFSMGTFAQSNLATADAAATIVAPIAIAYDNQALSFGRLAVLNALAGTVDVAATLAGTRTSADVSLLSGGVNTAARFIITGNAGSTYAVTLPASSTITIGVGAANNMTIDGFLSSASGTIPVGGSETFYVGATLNVNAVQNTGNYTGTFDVSVNYN